MKKWDVIETIYIYKNPFGNLRVDKCLLPNGNMIEKYYVNEYPDWVNIVAITSDKKMLFVKQYRHGCKEFFLEIPAGGIKENEDTHIAILRELREETGYISDQEPVLLGDFYTNPALANNKVKTYILLDIYKKFDQHTDDTEEIEYMLFSFDKINEMIKLGQINQMFTVTAYCLAKNYLEKKGWL